MRKKEILAEQYHKKYPCSEFEFSDLGDSEHYLPIAESAMQEYADEFACAFAEWLADKNYSYSVKEKCWFILYSEENYGYITTELLEIFKKEINGK